MNDLLSALAAAEIARRRSALDYEYAPRRRRPSHPSRVAGLVRSAAPRRILRLAPATA